MFEANSFFPKEFIIREIKHHKTQLQINLTASQEYSSCPVCGESSDKIHSHYFRSLFDLPLLGCQVFLQICCRKFFCKNKDCKRHVFTERFKGFVLSYARCTERLKQTLLVLSASTNCVTASKVSKHLNIGKSRDTLLRNLKQASVEESKDVPLIGIDDFAYKKGSIYGTIVVDLETHQPIALFEERTSSALQGWLTKYPDIELVSRDRSKSYKEAIELICPNAIQVADRFHIVKNFLEAFKEFLKRSFPNKIFLGFKEIKIEQEMQQKQEVCTPPLEKEEKSESRKRKEELVKEVKALYEQGSSKQGIAKKLGMTRRTVRKYIRLSVEQASTYAKRSSFSMNDKHKEFIIEKLKAKKTVASIFRELQTKNYKGSGGNLRKYVQKLRKENEELQKEFKETKAQKEKESKREEIERNQLLNLMWTLKEEFNEDQEKVQTLEKILKMFPWLFPLYCLVQCFREMFKTRESGILDGWLKEAQCFKIPELDSFVNGVNQDYDAVKNSLIYEYSNGVVEGHVNRLKMIKRMMYGRASFHLLKQRVLHQNHLLN